MKRQPEGSNVNLMFSHCVCNSCAYCIDISYCSVRMGEGVGLGAADGCLSSVMREKREAETNSFLHKPVSTDPHTNSLRWITSVQA